MEYLVALILGLAGFAYYQYDRRKKAEVDALLGEIKGKDSKLAEDQKMVQDEIVKIDQAIADLKEQRRKEAESKYSLSLKERADKWKK